MGDFRITIEAVGGHGCGRGSEVPNPDGGLHVARCRLRNCPDCAAIALVDEMKRNGCRVAKAVIEHWPVPGAAGTGRDSNPGPIDDLVNGTRDRKWS
jgi:hypothetical protein